MNYSNSYFYPGTPEETSESGDHLVTCTPFVRYDLCARYLHELNIVPIGGSVGERVIIV